MTLTNQRWLLPAVSAVVGFALGALLFAVVLPPSVINTDPWDLRPEARAQWISMAADSFSLNGDRNLAKERMRGMEADAGVVLGRLVAERNQQGRPLEAQRLQNFATANGYTIVQGPAASPAPGGGAAPAPAGGPLDSLMPLLLVLLLVVVGVAGYLVLRQRGGLALSPLGGGSGARSSVAEAEEPRFEPAAASAPRPAATGGVSPAAAKPIFGTFAATYKFGDDNYDTSFSLETPRGDFLGETGMGVSEAIGEGKPDKVTAFDLWLFDKGDVRTVTKILMSEYAYNDQTLRNRLMSKGELVLAERGKRIILETATLRVEAEIADLVYASTPGLPANSHFQKLIVEMVPAQR